MPKENILSKYTIYIYIYIYIYICMYALERKRSIYEFLCIYIHIYGWVVNTTDIILALSDDCVAAWYTCTLYLH